MSIKRNPREFRLKKPTRAPAKMIGMAARQPRRLKACDVTDPSKRHPKETVLTLEAYRLK